jgi:hypothetical protein
VLAPIQQRVVDRERRPPGEVLRQLEIGRIEVPT